MWANSQEPPGVLGRGRAPLQLVERVRLLAGAVGQELGGEHLAERRVVAAPADPSQLDVERRLPPSSSVVGPDQPALGIGPARTSRLTRSGWRTA